MDYTYVSRNVNQIRREVEDAAKRAGRGAEDVDIVAVTKSASPDVLPWLVEAGIRNAAENRWQVARDKFEHKAATDLTWHFIGSLQTNKVKYIVPRFSWIHSVDRMELALALSEEAKRNDKNLRILIQVNVAEEEQKHGFAVDDVLNAAQAMSMLPNIELCGLMTMAPVVDNPDDARPVFRALRELRDTLSDALSIPSFQHLSMGMSDDFPVAIEEGATLVRVGRKLVNP